MFTIRPKTMNIDIYLNGSPITRFPNTNQVNIRLIIITVDEIKLVVTIHMKLRQRYNIIHRKLMNTFTLNTWSLAFTCAIHLYAYLGGPKVLKMQNQYTLS